MPTYHATTTCNSLNESGRFVDDYLVDDSQALAELLDYVGFPEQFKQDITAAIVIVDSGDYDAVWLSESGRYYDLTATYYALPYYRPDELDTKNLPIYWLETNPYYQTK